MDIYGKEIYVKKKLYKKKIIQRCDNTRKRLHREKIELNKEGQHGEENYMEGDYTKKKD